MEDTSERFPWKRDTKHLAAQDVHTLEASAWELVKLYDDNGPQHPDAPAWIEGGLDICTRIKEIALEKQSLKLLDLAHRMASEFQGAAQQINVTLTYARQQSGIIAATSAPMPAADSARWKR